MYTNKCRTSTGWQSAQQAERGLRRKRMRGREQEGRWGTERRNRKQETGTKVGLRQIPSSPRSSNMRGGTKTTRVEEMGGTATKGCRKQHTKRPPNAEKTNTEKQKQNGSFRLRTRQRHRAQVVSQTDHPAIVVPAPELLELAPAHELGQPLRLVRAPWPL
jgi:hypothetical protein